MLIAAARLRKSLVFRGNGKAPLGWEDMLASDEAMAGEDAPLLGLIDDLRVEGSKGVASGPLYQIGTLESGKVSKFPGVGFATGVYAEVYVEATGEADLNILVYDSAGKLVCSDTDPSPIAYCGWTADSSDAFVMQVQNLGPQGSSYALMTN